jgi:hypothetical protein
MPTQDNSNRAEAPAQRGQIFVKTVPPSTKRADLEEVSCQPHQPAKLTEADVLSDQGLFAFSHHRAFDQEAILPSSLGAVYRGHGPGGCIEETQQHKGGSSDCPYSLTMLTFRSIHSPSTLASTQLQSLAVYG